MLLILVGVLVAVIGVIRLARSLEPGQRIVLVLAFIAALVYLTMKAVDMGLLGRHSNG